MAYVYKHIRLDKNEVFYIGIGSDLNYDRAFSKKQRNKYWIHIINITEYSVEVIEENLKWEDACNREKHYIKKYGRKDLNEGTLANMTDGGDGLNNPSKSIRDKYRKLYGGKTFIERYGKERAKEIGDKISKANMGKKKPKQSLAMKGKYVGDKNPMYGKNRSSEFKEDRRRYMLENNPGKNKTEETKKRISESKKGTKSPFKGKPRKRVVCPHCNKEGGEGLMHRWHFDNCKFKK